MCGINGILSSNGGAREHLADIARSMADTLTHRGPDDSGIWTDSKAGITLGHRRLAILDLTPSGRQPMTSPCGRFVLCHNGEIYNHNDLRRELGRAGHAFEGTSDTETMLAAFREWGVQGAVNRFIGMFAFALWDSRERQLFLARDRVGIKPLYYGRVAGSFIFGSELKALKAFPGFDADIDRNSLALYFRHNYIPAPYSIYKGIRKLPPGSILTVDGNGTSTIDTYWSIRDVWTHGARTPLDCSRDEAAGELERLLSDAVTMRLLSDVPLGVFLSGGIDSSTVAALAQAASPVPIRTFSIGFDDPAFNEAEQARQVADHLGTNHTELYLTPRDLLDTVPLIPKFWDEPFADSSQIPTYCLSRLTRQHVSVALSGDGGDELFSGYERYTAINRAWNQVRFIPLGVRKLLAAVGKRVPAKLWGLAGSMGPKIHWRLDALGCEDYDSLYHFLLSNNRDPERFVTGSTEPVTPFTEKADLSGRTNLDHFQTMSLIDLQTYLPDDILTKVDRASMGVALEARVPLLDHRVVEFAARVPTSWKIHENEGKQLLKHVLYKHVPQALIDRPKKGFAVPIDSWLKRELRDWAETLLDERTIRSQGFIDSDQVRFMWREYLAGQRNWFSHLWDVLMFQAWLEEDR